MRRIWRLTLLVAVSALCAGAGAAHAQSEADLSLTTIATPRVAPLASAVTYTSTVRNDSTSTTATDVRVRDTLPPVNTIFSSATSSSGGCTHTSTVDCSLGDLPPGATATVTVVVFGARVGLAPNSATVSSGTPDPDGSNNSSSAATLIIVPAYSGVVLQSHSATVGSGRVASIRVLCPPKSFFGCKGTLFLTKASTRVGSAPFLIHSGQVTRARVKVSTRAFKLLRRKHALKVLVRATSFDAAGTFQTVRRHVTLRLDKAAA